MIQISNEKLTVQINPQGAELQSIVRKDNGLEYLWSGDPAFWGKKSPVLFPIVGGLTDNTYHYNGQNYTLGRHGFAREQLFTVTEQAEEHVILRLSDNETTRKVYPFHFDFTIQYLLQDDQLQVTYQVKNQDDKTLLFSVGAHPAFKVPLTPDTTYEDYYLYFNKEEEEGIWPLTAGGQIQSAPVPFLHQTHELPLKKSLFYKDALVFKNLDSTAISIKSHLTRHGLTLAFEGFPYMGIWAAKDADFVCIEPWCGIADSVDATGALEEKEGINRLEPGRLFERTWTATIF
ncbi:aldose 1-epimerase family protein [Chitinophaga arvensicola]|uniref:Galactose mutarotase n=1 Tax=Chitinophaga arvensicola TaxID=29529 RepID=A0A1I0RJ16_9BACT|nr:aldose 1-epimerase family protein [Chitinophaga arvensicola]SEW40970.1 Galactose mutarotase [Chitinophaga arvensicola]